MPATVQAGLARAFIADVFAAAGFPAADAARIGELMTEADLTGADAHGIFRLPHYIRAPSTRGKSLQGILPKACVRMRS